MLAQLHTVLSPRVEVSLHVDGSTHTLLLANRPVLVKGPSTVDGWLVVAGGQRDIVSAAVTGDGSLPLSTRAWVVCAVRFDNVVLYQGVASPAIDSKVSVTLRVEGSAVVDCSTPNCQCLAIVCSNTWILPAGSRVPSLSANKVSSVAPSHRVLAPLAHSVLGGAATVSPPRVEVSVVGAFRAWS